MVGDQIGAGGRKSWGWWVNILGMAAMAVDFIGQGVWSFWGCWTTLVMVADHPVDGG